ncbi:MAG TPA: FtsW/RodA/SpoVE family cell cycle protein [Candidatus Oscillibacter excrementigallinarum]|uniref:FtsW/RodA/SpoVE family cell cycle protein n=1 Tax=Candidatus Oscillibacter excrementigallinarum TaxID=2838716 RepID=A0A9D2LIH4_9FIRM|nr:FtsW/RodA/SpoVE family cell cycle protein [uncultured Oscillibacter sp.]HJB13121.1 FtsW/RodA/SpoVE family cell cycle protein [Candidatus Oscillibacter excrementigallinarum]
MWNRLKAILADFIQQADLVLLGLCCAATLYGMVLIASATHYMDTSGMSGMMRYVGVQGVALLLGLCAYVFMSMIDVEIVLKKWKWVVAFNIVFIGLLVTPLGVGSDTTGNQAWLKIPGIPFQIGPAEIVKITFTLLLAKQLEWLREEKRDLRSFPSAAMVAGHTLLLMGYYVVISGDMGNALTFFFIFLCMSFAAGFALRWFALLFAGGGAAFAAAWALELIPGYMMDRFRVLFDHSYDALDTGWQQTRSLMAIGSGGIFGQGYMQGTQTQSSYPPSLPNRWTDFIFSVCGEELGLIGCLLVIALLTAIIVRVLLVARNAQTPLHCYICVGMAAMLIYQTVINIGMCLFVMPTIGVTLPFFSYGGSSLLTLFAAMGVVSGIKKRSPMTGRRPGRPLV